MDNGSLKVLQRKRQRWSQRLESVPRSHEESKTHNCVRQAHTCYLQVGSCRQAKVKDWFLQPFQEAWQHTNKEADKTIPSAHQALRWPPERYSQVRIEGRGWNILRRGNSDSWKGRQVFPHIQGRWRIKWNDIRETLTCTALTAFRGPSQLWKTSNTKPSPPYAPLPGNESVQFRDISICRAKAQ